jgi:hypothetical protein
MVPGDRHRLHLYPVISVSNQGLPFHLSDSFYANENHWTPEICVEKEEEVPKNMNMPLTS